LGLPEEEIGLLNFLEFDALLKRKRMADDKARLNAGYIYAAIYNTAQGDPNRRAVQPADIVPSMAEDQNPDMSKMTAQQQKYHLFNVFMGRGKRALREK
jgi:hypothetical protein